MSILWVLLLLLMLTRAVAPLNIQVVRAEDRLLIYNSSMGVNPDIYSKEIPNNICTPKKQLFTSFRQDLEIMTSQGPFLVEAFTDSAEVDLTGLGISKFHPEESEHEAKIIVLTSCKNIEFGIIYHTLGLRITLHNLTEEVLIPLALSCFPQASSMKIEYIILQFINGAIFASLLVAFSRFNTPAFSIKPQLPLIATFLLLPFVDKFTSFLFDTFVVSVWMYKFLFPSTFGLGYLCLVMIAFAITYVLNWGQFNLTMWLHYVPNILTLYVGTLVFKPTRFRYLVLFLVLFTATSPLYQSLTSSNIHLKIFFDVIFKNESYECVSMDIWEMLGPLVASVFVVRSLKNSPRMRNFHTLVHFVIYMSMGVVRGFKQMMGTVERDSRGRVAVAVLLSSVVLGMLQGTLREIVKFRDTHGY